MTDWPSLKSMLMIGSVTMLRTVAEFSAATLPIPVSTIGKFCCLTVVAMTGTGGGGSGDRSAGTVRKMPPSQVPPGGECEHYEADEQRGSAPALDGGFVGSNRWRGHRILFPHDCGRAERETRAVPMPAPRGRPRSTSVPRRTAISAIARARVAHVAGSGLNPSKIR